MKKYYQLEQNIISCFSNHSLIIFEGEQWVVSTVGKPRPSDGKGECKTDVYVKLVHPSKDAILELKISVKTKKSHHWQESKLNELRAKNIFGDNFREIISRSTSSIKDEFLNSYLLYLDSFGNTRKNSLTMGWRLEITNKKRRLSSPLGLSDDEIVDSFYKGINLDESKRNSIVNGEEIINSGISNYILFIDLEDSKDISFILKNLINLDVFCPEPLFLTFIANNYRFKSDKIDGNRPLAVYIDYAFDSSTVKTNLVFNNPLSVKGKDLCSSIKETIHMPLENYSFEQNIVFKKSP